MRVFAVAFAMTAVVSAFAPVRFARPSTKIFNDLDSSEAVKAAMEASEKFGKSSKEARIAWETVEEMDASKSHTPKATATEEAPVAAAAAEKETFVVSTRDEALAQAEAITKEKGIASPEARLAWELVEELAATESHHNKYGTG